MSDTEQNDALDPARFTVDVRNATRVTPSAKKTYLILAAVAKDESKNSIQRISCKKGLPITGYVHCLQTDTYAIPCADYVHIGEVPASYTLAVKGISNWSVPIPMPEKVILRLLSAQQKKEVKAFKNSFSPDEFLIEFVQLLEVN